jgi:radial spoke head protein 4A
MDDAALLEWAGVSFGRGETYRLYLSIKRLAESLPGEADKARLFGKINTRGKPYYIVEALSTFEGEEVDPTKQEGKEGANKFEYFVSQNPEAGGWIKLPPVTMAQISTSRQFKRLLTGNLDAPVGTYPIFPGTERNLLRAIIGRIAGATSISPDGYFGLDDDGELKPAEAEDFANAFPKDGEALKDPEAWKHHVCDLNSLGRVRAMPEQLGEDGEPIVEDEPVEATAQLSGLTAEVWSIRVGPGGAGVAATSGAVAKSLLWPGAVAVAAGRRFINCYVGNGVMYDPKPYSPPLPSRTQAEWAPAEEEAPLVETPDVKNDPTPPKAAEETEE